MNGQESRRGKPFDFRNHEKVPLLSHGLANYKWEICLKFIGMGLSVPESSDVWDVCDRQATDRRLVPAKDEQAFVTQIRSSFNFGSASHILM